MSANLNFSIDPRMELLASIEFLSNGIDIGFGPLNKLESTYKKEFVEYFSPFKNHPIIEFYSKMITTMSFNLDATGAVMFNLTNPPQLEPIYPFDQSLIQRAKGKPQLDEFLKLLREFAKETKFTSFFEGHEQAFRKIIENTQKELKAEDVVEPLESYYGMKQHSYTALLVPLFREGGGNGFRIKYNKETYDAYAIIGPDEVKDTLAYFTSRKLYILWHEFSHHFIDPITIKLGKELEPRFSPLYTPMKGYPNWFCTVNEYLIRAVTARIHSIKNGDNNISEILEGERKQGFVFIYDIYDKLKDYETNRSTYPTFKEFYPEIVKTLEQTLTKAKHTSLSHNKV